MNTGKQAGFKLIGLQLEHKTSNLNGQSDTDCGALWQKFETEKLAEKIPDKVGDEIYAVYFGYEGGHLQPFSYFIGCKVKPDAATPAGMTSLQIPEQHYSKVVAKGTMPGCVSESWRNIWAAGLARTYQHDFEVYDERSKDWSNAEVDIYIATAAR